MKQLETLTLSRGATNVIEFDFNQFQFIDNSYCQFMIKKKNSDEVICKINFNKSKKYYVTFKDEFTVCLCDEYYQYDIMYMINDERYRQCLISDVKVEGVVNSYDGIFDKNAIEVAESIKDDVPLNQSIKVFNVQDIIVNSITQEKVVQPAVEEQIILPDIEYNALSKVTISPVVLEVKTVTPTKMEQIINADEGLGLSKVIVESIPNDYIIPNGSLEITKNGEYDVKEKASVNVKTSGIDINEYFNTNSTTITNLNTQYWIKNNYFLKLPDIIIPDNVTSLSSFCTTSNGNVGLPLDIAPKIICNNNVKYMQNLYFRCEAKEIDVSGLNTSNVENVNGMFNTCSEITSLDMGHFDFSKVNNIGGILTYCNKLQNLIFAKNLGKGFTQKTANYYNYTLSLSWTSKLSHDSLMDIINKLYDLNLTYDVANGGTLYTQKLVLGSTNLAKLTEEEVAIATNKGWSVSAS